MRFKYLYYLLLSQRKFSYWKSVAKPVTSWTVLFTRTNRRSPTLAIITLRKVRLKLNSAQVGPWACVQSTIVICVAYTRQSSWNAKLDTLEPDRPQLDLPVACVIAQRYSSSSSSCVRFNSCKLKFNERLKTSLYYFLTKNWESLKLRSLHWIRKIQSQYFRGGGIRNISLIQNIAHRPEFERITAHHELKLGKLRFEPACPVECEQNNVLFIACLCGWPSICRALWFVTVLLIDSVGVLDVEPEFYRREDDIWPHG